MFSSASVATSSDNCGGSDWLPASLLVFILSQRMSEMNMSVRAAVSNTTTTAVTMTPTTSLSEFGGCELVIEGRAVVLTGVLIMIGAFVERAIELAW